MRIDQSLFEGEHICFGPIDHERDPQIESLWTHDSSYLRMISLDPALPLSPARIKKRYEAIEKEQADGSDLYYFALRMRSDDRLIGFARLYWIEWSNGAGFIQLGIGDPKDRGHGYGTEALALLLRFAFDELNLYRLTAVIAEYNLVALHVFCQAGFVEEVRRRQSVNRDGRRWDLIHLGILQADWQALQPNQG